MPKDFRAGIVGFETYLPKEKITAEELSPLVNIPAEILRNKMGINEKFVGGEEDHAAAMATKASKALLERLSIDPNSIDMILYAGETYCEYVCWTAGIKVQNELGADRAFAFDLGFRCAATPLALKMAKDMMRADDQLNRVLICGGNTNAYLVDYQDPNQSFMFDMSPAGMAVLVDRDHPENEILETAILTDHVFCDDVIGKYGGTLHPIDEEIAADPEALRRAKLLHLPDPEGMKKRLGERSLPNFVQSVEQSLERSGIDTPPDFVGITHINPKAHRLILQALNVAEENAVYLSDEGHCGHADQWIALSHGIERGQVKDGDICALVGAGTGYAFGSTLIRWGGSKDAR